MIKKVLISASCIFILSSCGTAPVNTNLNTTSQTNSVSLNTNITTPTTSSNSTKFSAEMVAAHNTTSDCWAIINGKVYDLTNWQDQHMGGKEAILRNCGKDISSLSGSHPGGDFSSSELQEILSEFYKGDIE